MSKLHISSTLSLPLEAVTQTFAIVARKRVGKTYTASVMAEEFIKAKVPIVVLDPTGAWWGLRSSADGAADGFPVVIIGGSHADVPLDEHAGKIIADLVVDHPGFYVIDFSLTESESAQDRFATDFGAHFYRRKESAKFPMHLFVDEADCFMPQKPFPGQQRMLGAYDTIVRRGGIRGIGVTLITQRPAVLNKNALTQAETLIALQISGSQDIDAIEHWIRIHGTKAQRDEMIGSLASLQRGECWFWSPSWLEKFERVKIRVRETFNSSATPKVGEKVIIAPKLASVDIAKLGDRIKAAAENIKANDPKVLKAEIAKLKKDLNHRDTETQRAAKTETKIKEVPVFTKTERKELGLLVGALETLAKLGEKAFATIEPLTTLRSMFTPDLQRIKAVLEGKFPAAAVPMSRVVARSSVGRPAMGSHQRTEVRQPAAGIPSTVHRPPSTNSNGHLPEGEKKILAALIQFPDGLRREQLTVLTTFKRSTRDAYIQRLREKEYVLADGDLIHATEAGIAALPDAEPLPTGEALQQYWLGKLPEGERRIFEILLAAYPESVDREVISEQTEFKRSTRDAYLKRMSAKMIFTEPSRGQVRAADQLFA